MVPPDRLCLYHPIALANTGHALTEVAHWKAVVSYWIDLQSPEGSTLGALLKPTGYLLFAGLYLLSMFIATFFNVAFFHEILHALDGRPVSIRSGVQFAISRLRAIVIWSLFAGLVGLLIKAVEERVDAVGRWIVALIGLTWSVASVFTIPVIVREGQSANPLRYLRSSASILRRTWGEAIVGYAGIALGQIVLLVSVGWFFLLMLPLAILFRSVSMFLAAGIAGVGCIVFVWYVLIVINQVYRGALYVYATEGVVPGPFNESDMNLAWKITAARKAR